MNINQGEFVAFIGSSGSGKSTLFKILMGLTEPSHGQLLIDGTPIEILGKHNWRTAISGVAQSEQLFTGTIAQNIAALDPQLDMDKVIVSAIKACIHHDIEKMPMKYLSYIGDMGSALSAGQKQRLMLARALYKEPKVLFLDEGTANLDSKIETDIADVIFNLKITRCVIAHRPELISRADKIFEVSEGKVVRLHK